MIKFLPLLYTISALCFLSCTASKKNVLLVTDFHNKEPRNFHTLLITGQGDVASRYDIENMSRAIRNKLLKANMHCQYVFLGDPRRVDINANLKKALTATRYDALLRITPQEARIKKLYRLPTGPYSNGTPSNAKVMNTPDGKTVIKSSADKNATKLDDGTVNRLVLQFSMVLTEAQTSGVIWTGTLTTNTQGPPIPVIHNTIGKRLAAEFKANQLLPVPIVVAGN